MATLDIFQNDAFSVATLRGVINDIPRVATPIADQNLFNSYGIATTTMMIERQGSTLKLVPAAPRGGIRQPVALGPRSMIPVASVHLPQSGSVLADEVQGIRAFGQETEVMQASALVRTKLVKMRAQLDLTIEFQRIGAIMGIVYDYDGVTPLLNMYTTFGMTQQTVFMNFASATADIKQKAVDIKRKIQAKLGGRSFTKVRVKCSTDFFDALTSHATVKKAYELLNQNAYARDDQSGTAFEYPRGVVWEEYAGGVGDTYFIPAGEAYAYPEGVSGLFETAYSPADYMETVNTQGVPYYAKQEAMKFNRGIELESQSNPINLCTLPEAVIRLDADAS